jgi:hypothetical protein
MSLDDFEREEEDRIQYEMQLAGQGGKKCKVWPSSDHRGTEPKKAGPAKVETTADYRLTLRNVRTNS